MKYFGFKILAFSYIFVQNSSSEGDSYTIKMATTIPPLNDILNFTCFPSFRNNNESYIGEREKRMTIR